MSILSTVLIVLILLASVALILVVMVQKSKGGGLAASFSSANNIMGVRKSTDLLEKMTWWFFGVVAAMCVVVSMVHFKGSAPSNDLQNAIEQKANQSPAQPTLPSFGGDAPTDVAQPSAVEQPSPEAITPAE